MANYKDVEVGGLYPTTNYGMLEVLSIRGAKDADVRFLATGYEAKAEVGQIRKGSVKDWSLSMKEWQGKIMPTLSFGDIEILEYVDGFNVKVRFLNTGFEAWYPAGNIKKGKIMDYMAPSFSGVGYIGVGPHNSGNQLKAYKHWAHMIQRCYVEAEEFKNYADVWVKTEWHNFQNFTNWAIVQIGFENNWQLDKDILLQGNKEYGPDTCCFVPARINSLVIKSNPNGKATDRFGTTYFSIRKADGTRVNKGFKDRDEGKSWHKSEREKIIKEVADEYKNVLDSRVYKALYSWQVNG